jgi:GT2 family glycosyltransferase
MNERPYLSDAADLAALAAIPLESVFRAVPKERTIARLRTERSLFEGGVVTCDPAVPWLTAVVLAERAGDGALKETLASLALQSCPNVRCAVVAVAGVDRLALAKFIDRLTLRPAVTETVPDLSGENLRSLRKARYVTFLRHGDRLHPSAAAWLAIHAASPAEKVQPADLVAWGELQPDGKGGVSWAQRNPAIQRETLYHYPYLRNAFAISSRLAVAYSGDFVQELIGNSLHRFQIWAASKGVPRWIAHPEYFLLRSEDRRGDRPEKAAQKAFSGQGAAYRDLFQEIAPGFRFVEHDRDAYAPYRLIPRETPGVVSVVILFRDKPDLTLRAIASIARQSFRGFLELVLVNNQSTAESLSAIKEGLDRISGAISSIRIIDFNYPFNHSRQCNVGVEASLGDVIVLMNNDCELLSTEALSELSAWAAISDVASVGICMIDPITSKESSGIEARLSPSNYFDSIVEERSGDAVTPFVRECFGNTFACAAFARSVFDRVGGLDAHRFPNGYNDVDFVCRTRAMGMRHLVLGHLKATHSPGQSRSRTDESPQKILIREMYPQAVGALGELILDEGLVRMAEKRQPKS